MARKTAVFYREAMQPLLALLAPFRALRPLLVTPASALVASDDTLVLPADGRIVALRLRQPARLRVLSGRAWITRVGWPDDHWLAAGETLDLPAPPSGPGWRLMLSGDGETPVTLKAETLR